MKDGFYRTPKGTPYEVCSNQIMVEHENGYYGCLYGKSSMQIFYKGRMIFHTGKRAANNADELYERLATMSEVAKKFEKIYSDEREEE